MSGNKPDLTNPNHTFDNTKDYKRVVFQQGKPVLDVDLNDLSEALETQTVSALVEKMGFGPPQLHYKDWVMGPVNAGDPSDNRNKDNFSISLGRLDTSKGIVDTRLKSDKQKNDLIVYDYHKLLVNSTEVANDLSFGNYLLKGAITALDTTGNVITDVNKSFSSGHRLLAFDENLTISGAVDTLNTITSTSNNLQTSTIKSYKIRVNEDACRLVVGTNSYSITNFTETTITVSGDTSALAVGDTYYILPPNTLSSYRAEYDATTTHETSKSEGLTGLPQLLTYVQVFEEDINTVEDNTIQSSAFGDETTHRTQLRWCVRVAKVRQSTDADPTFTSLKEYHIRKYFTDEQYDRNLLLKDSTRFFAGLGSENSAYLRPPVFWRHYDSANSAEHTTLEKQESPYSDSYGLTPLHFLNRYEHTVDYLFWTFIKAVLLQETQLVTRFNDFVPLNMFHSESKPLGHDQSEDALDYDLSEFFFPNKATQLGSTTLAWLSLSNQYSGTGLPAKFKSAPRVLHTHADLSMDNMQSRGLFGLDNELLYGTHAPLVFDSVKSHMSFLDQATIGLLGLGSGQGQTLSNKKIPSAVNYTLGTTNTGLADSGYGVGRITPINPLASSSEADGFLTGGSQYLLREKGSRSSHVVNHDDAELGWSFYKNEAATLTSNITGSTLSDFSVRGWDEGLAQSSAFLNGLNFRKLAIKTTAHKSQDLFTISERPISTNVELNTGVSQNASGTAFQIPYNQSQANNGNLFIDSYSGSGNDATLSLPPQTNFDATNFIPANVSKYDPKNLLSGYQASGGIKDFRHYVEATGTTSDNYGPWNRFNTDTLVGPLASADNLFVNDLWSNRCTAMRLRYHVGDFYPGDDDARGVPRNLLVDSMNLFVKVEPLSLAHWMTMPKHQHSILENSISFAEGIEALLKVAHGIGDTQKLINGSNQPLIQANSPITNNTEYPLYQNYTEGSVDPTNLPFEHHRQPFVHWYHPAMHKIEAPHPNGTASNYTNSSNVAYNLTVYPKFGRRSLIIPALVPSTFGVTSVTESGNDISVVYVDDSSQSPSNAFPDHVSDDTNEFDGFTVDLNKVTGGTGLSTSGLGSIPYPYHGSKSTNTGTTNYTTDNNSTITARNNQITFPAIGTSGGEITPGPVFLPASRIYVEQDGSQTKATIGFNTLLTDFSTSYWDDVSSSESTFPYDEAFTHYAVQAGGANELPAAFQNSFSAWSTPVLKAAINTHTVAGIVQLVRTKFRTGLDSSSLPSHYTEFTLPGNAFDNYASGDYTPNQIPAVGPDNPLDTLFVGDLGTALGLNSKRAGFMSPLNLGVPMRVGSGLMPNDMAEGTWDVRDSWELAYAKYNSISDDVILNSFTAIQNMGLQQKLMWNCSFRVLHARPSGSVPSVISSAPKSITEVFLAHDRREGAMTKKTFETPTGGFDKPFIHLMSMHPYTNNSFPNKSYSDHLYSMVSDSTGGTHDSSAYIGDALDSYGDVKYDYDDLLVNTSSMGDTYAADPFDTAINSRLVDLDNPVRAFDNLNANSGIEIDLLSELGTIHTNPLNYNVSTTISINENNDTFTLLDTMPSANELTLPGDHELIFVLYTGHYGAKQHDTNNVVDISYIPPVAGCHLTATLEINRPSERTDSTPTTNIHYGKTLYSDDQPIKTHAILSTK